MGILLSLIFLPVQAINERREKKKAQKVAASYSSQSAPAPSSQPESQAPQATRLPQASSAAQASEGQKQQPREQQQPQQDELNNTLGAARAGLSTAAADTKASAPGEPDDATNTNTDTNLPAVSATQPATARKMASDEDYMAFLNKANADPSAGVAKTSSSGGVGAGKVQLKTVDRGVDIPQVLKAPTEKEEWIYVSDADEPFVAVSLCLAGGKLPDQETFAKLIDHPDPAQADVEIMDVVEWDSGGQYRDVVEACRKAAMGGDVRVYRVKLGGTRVEYWVVAVEGESKRKGQEGRLVGVKALAVES